MKLKSIQNFFYVIIALLVLPLTTHGAAGELPQVNCAGLPGCVDNDLDQVTTRLGGFISDIMIKYVAVAAVIALMLAGAMYLVSGGEEEKVKKAKTWVIWALAGVLISVSASLIINIVNNLFIS